MKELAETQRYQVYATPTEFNAQNEQPLIEAVKTKAYEPVTIESDTGTTEETDASSSSSVFS